MARAIRFEVVGWANEFERFLERASRPVRTNFEGQKEKKVKKK
jgi:hypothetical protein